MSALVQGSQEWLDVRKMHIGASDCPVIMGDSPRATPFELWQEKVGLKQPRETTWYMQDGLDAEPEARDWFEKTHGMKMEPKVLFHKSIPYLMASLDGISTCGKYILEIKKPCEKDHEAAKKGKVPKKYYAQLQMQLEVTEAFMVFYLSVHDEERILVEIKRDDIYIERLLEKVEGFHRCQEQHIPPEMTEKEKRRMSIKQMTDDQWSDLLQGYQEATAKAEWWETEIKNIKEKLIELAGGSDARGAGFKLSKVVTTGRIDYDAILKQYGIDVDLEQYRKPSTESWRITRDD